MFAPQSKLRTSAAEHQRLLDEKEELLREVDALSEAMTARTQELEQQNQRLQAQLFAVPVHCRKMLLKQSFRSSVGKLSQPLV